MCRFLLAKSKNPLNPKAILEKFSIMAEKSKAFDGDWQGDGWGFSWIDEKNQWQLYRSLSPVWQDTKTFETFPSSSIFTIHARSASFPQHKNNLEYNQPYTNESYSYVFNGLLKGVTLSLPGQVGAQKIWLLLNDYLKKMNLTQALYKTSYILKNNSHSIQALNIGVAGKDTISAYCFYSQHPKYYSLYYLDRPDLKIIASEPIGGFSFKPLLTNSLITL
jgi:predicted glutamine amidotransferase